MCERELSWGHPQGRVNAQRVVPMNREVYLCNQLAQGLEALRISELGFEFSIEGLLIPVLPGTARFAAGNGDTGALKKRDERSSIVFDSVVTVEERRTGVREECIHECFGDENGAASRGDSNADNVSGVHIHGGGDAYVFAFPCEVREVGNPCLMRICGHEPHQEVRIRYGLLSRFLPSPASPAIRLDAEESHDPLNLLLVLFEMERDSAISVCRELPQCFLDPYLERPVLVGLLLLIPECRAGYAKQPCLRTAAESVSQDREE